MGCLEEAGVGLRLGMVGEGDWRGVRAAVGKVQRQQMLVRDPLKSVTEAQ